jgi:hypothetical protein
MPETAEEKAARELRERTAGGGNGGGERRYASAEEIALQVTRMLASNNGDEKRTIAQLITDNRKVRDKLRITREQLTASEAKVPKDALVLSGDDKKLYDEFKALNIKPSEAKKRIELATQLEEKELKATRDKSLAEAAGSLGYNDKVFVDLVNDKKLHVEMRDGMVDGKAVKLPYMRPAADDKAPLILAKDYVTQNLAGYVPSLTAKPAQGAGAGTGTGFPAQSGGTSTAPPSGAADSTRNSDGTPKPLPGGQKYLSPSERTAAQKSA